MDKRFKIVFLEDAAEFLNNLDQKAREKILFNINKAQVLNDKDLFKKLTDDIWEFRTLFNKTHYRLFAFWDKTDKQESLVVMTHGIVKKTDKTPLSDIQKAEKLRKLYFEQK